MTSINPFSGYIAQATAVERTQASDKTRQVRRTQELSKNVATRDDEMEHQVESSDQIAAIHDDQSHQEQQPGHQQPKSKKDEKVPHIDVKA